MTNQAQHLCQKILYVLLSNQKLSSYSFTLFDVWCYIDTHAVLNVALLYFLLKVWQVDIYQVALFRVRVSHRITLVIISPSFSGMLSMFKPCRLDCGELVSCQCLGDDLNVVCVCVCVWECVCVSKAGANCEVAYIHFGIYFAYSFYILILVRFYVLFTVRDLRVCIVTSCLGLIICKMLCFWKRFKI